MVKWLVVAVTSCASLCFFPASGIAGVQAVGDHAALSVTVTGSVGSSAVRPGQQQTLTAVVLSNVYLSPAMVDFEVYDSAGLQVFHQAQKVRLVANHLTRVVQHFTPMRKAFGGLYTFKAGVFSPTWKQMYAWNNDAANFAVHATPRPNLSATGTLAPNKVRPGVNVTLTARVSVTGRSLSNLIVDIEVHRGAKKVFQRYKMKFTVRPHRIEHYTVHWNVPWNEPKGVYTLEIGIFNSGWTILYWNADAATVT